jgi:hypothetical protein
MQISRREHNKLGFAVQLCVIRHPGRVLAAGEIPPRAMLKYVAEQIGADPTAFTIYARREETRRDHVARPMILCREQPSLRLGQPVATATTAGSLNYPANLPNGASQGQRSLLS